MYLDFTQVFIPAEWGEIGAAVFIFASDPALNGCNKSDGKNHRQQICLS